MQWEETFEFMYVYTYLHVIFASEKWRNDKHKDPLKGKMF